MKSILGVALLMSIAAPAMAADCIYYKDADRLGERFEQTATAQTYELKNGLNDVISSVWIREGYYAVLSADLKFQGKKIHLYGSGMSFTQDAWQFDKGAAAAGGTWYNLVPLAFNDIATSVLCLKLP